MMKVVKDTKESKRIENRMITGLSSNDKDVIVKTIKFARKNANASHLIPLLNLLKETKDDAVSGEVIALLNDLKDQNTMAPLMTAIESDEYKSIRIFLLLPV